MLSAMPRCISGPVLVSSYIWVLVSMVLVGEVLAETLLVQVESDEKGSVDAREQVEWFLTEKGHSVLDPTSGLATRIVNDVRTECMENDVLDEACVTASLKGRPIDLLWLDVKTSVVQENRVVVVISARRFRPGRSRVPSAQRQCVDCENNVEFGNTVVEVIAAAMDIEWTKPDRGSDGKTGKPEAIGGARGQAGAEKARNSDSSAPMSSDLAISKPGRRFGNWKWVALGGGVALAALGGVGIAIDGRDRVKNGMLQDKEWGTGRHGIAAVTAGGVLLGAAAIMIISDRRSQRKRDLIVQLWDTGIGIGFGGKF